MCDHSHSETKGGIITTTTQGGEKKKSHSDSIEMSISKFSPYRFKWLFLTTEPIYNIE